MTHSIETDYFAVGVIAFECMMGYRPYTGRTEGTSETKLLQDKLSSGKAMFHKAGH